MGHLFKVHLGTAWVFIECFLGVKVWRETERGRVRGSWKSDRDNDRDLDTLHTPVSQSVSQLLLCASRTCGRNSLIGRSEIKQEIVETVWQSFIAQAKLTKIISDQSTYSKYYSITQMIYAISWIIMNLELSKEIIVRLISNRILIMCSSMIYIQMYTVLGQLVPLYSDVWSVA